MALALDTNCLLRWLLEDNKAQAAIVEKHLASSQRQLHVADMALAEVVWVLSSTYGFPDVLVEGFVRKIVEQKKITCNRVLFNQVLEHLNTSPKVSFVETCLAFYAGLSNAQLLTFDKTLAKKFPRLVQLAG